VSQSRSTAGKVPVLPTKSTATTGDPNNPKLLGTPLKSKLHGESSAASDAEAQRSEMSANRSNKSVNQKGSKAPTNSSRRLHGTDASKSTNGTTSQSPRQRPPGKRPGKDDLNQTMEMLGARSQPLGYAARAAKGGSPKDESTVAASASLGMPLNLGSARGEPRAKTHSPRPGAKARSPSPRSATPRSQSEKARPTGAKTRDAIRAGNSTKASPRSVGAKGPLN
jgi:hypothetical protein